MSEKTIKPQYILFDAREKILGRLAVEIAKTLIGKNEINYAPNVGGKDWAIVINSDKVMLSGEKEGKKKYYRHSGYPGSIRDVIFKKRMEQDSPGIIFDAVKGMLPKNKLSRQALRRLRIYRDGKHEFEDKISN